LTNVADPLFGASITEELRRDALHQKDVADALEALARRLEEEDIPFALVGALAMRHHGYVRHTEDIDVLTTPDGLERIHRRMVGRGFRQRAQGLRKKLRETEHRVDVDVLTSGEHAGSAESPVVYPDPRSAAFIQVEGIRIPDLPHMITFKLASGLFGHRPQDLGDVFQLIKANRLRKSFASKIPEPLRPKFLELILDVGRERSIEE
jgi:hypothetical protein